MIWQYKVSLFLMLLSQTVFLGLAAYYTDNQPFYPDGNLEAASTRGYSWIWYHFEHWGISLVLNLAGVVVFISGVLKEKNPDWKLSDFIKIEIVETDDEDSLN